MGVGEADHCGVAVMVAGTPVPGLGNACRAKLYHTEWHVGTYEYMAVATAAYLGVDIGSVVGRI